MNIFSSTSTFAGRVIGISLFNCLIINIALVPPGFSAWNWQFAPLKLTVRTVGTDSPEPWSQRFQAYAPMVFIIRARGAYYSNYLYSLLEPPVLNY